MESKKERKALFYLLSLKEKKTTSILERLASIKRGDKDVPWLLLIVSTSSFFFVVEAVISRLRYRFQ
jgi:hypothetical protein